MPLSFFEKAIVQERFLSVMGNIHSLQRRKLAVLTSPASVQLPPSRPFATPVHASSPLSGDQDQEHAKHAGWSLERIAVTSEDFPLEYRYAVNPAREQGPASPSVHVMQQKAVEASTRKENTTGLPDHLKTGIEDLSGLPLDDVQVYYNSSKPAEVQALAYTQGTKIHVRPGQEQHLAHEAWHVVQQKQGRVQPTAQVGEVSINDDTALEQEADSMSRRASELGPNILQKRAIQSAWPVSFQVIEGGNSALVSSHSSMVRPQGVLQRVYEASKGERNELIIQIKESWGANKAEERADDLIAWCHSNSQAIAIVRGYTFADYQQIKVDVAKKFHTSLDLGKNLPDIQRNLNELRGARPAKTANDAFDEAQSGEKLSVLRKLVNAKMISMGGFDGNAYVTQFDDRASGEFSVAVNITGMDRFVIHVHCYGDGKPKDSGNLPVSIKKRNDKLISGLGTLLPDSFPRPQLVPDPAVCLNHATLTLGP